MTDWAAEDLDTIGTADEIGITTLRRDGTARPYKPIWVVRVGDALFVRSYRGGAGDWFRHAQRHPQGRIRVAGTEHDIRFADAGATPNTVVDKAYRDKYGTHGGSYVAAMIRADAAITTLRILPH